MFRRQKANKFRKHFGTETISTPPYNRRATHTRQEQSRPSAVARTMNVQHPPSRGIARYDDISFLSSDRNASSGEQIAAKLGRLQNWNKLHRDGEAEEVTGHLRVDALLTCSAHPSNTEERTPETQRVERKFITHVLQQNDFMMSSLTCDNPRLGIWMDSVPPSEERSKG